MTLSLEDFKRPPQDNGRGIYGIASTPWTGGEKGLDYWIAELESLGVKWVKVLDSGGDSLTFCKKLLAAGIFPVVRILRHDPSPNDSPEPNPGHFNPGEEETVRKLLDQGVLYFETNSEPNLSVQWKTGAMPTDVDEAAKLVALYWLFDARFIIEAGGYPGLPAISVGSRMDLVGALASLGRLDILGEGCWLAIHNYGLNRPLTYPTDGVNQSGTSLPPEQYDCGPFTKWVWWNLRKGLPDSRDDINQMRASGRKPGSTVFNDHACFREHEYYAAVIQKHLGKNIPILSTEGGYSVGRRDDPRYPRINPEVHSDMTVAMFEYMQRDAPDYYFSAMPSLLIPSPGSNLDAWYGDYWQRTFLTGPRNTPSLPSFPVPDAKVGVNLPVVAAVKGMANINRSTRQQVSSSAVPFSIKPPPPPPPPSEESIYTVKPGETITSIATRFGATIPSLVALNRLTDPPRLVPGQKLIIPVLSIDVPHWLPPSAASPATQPSSGVPRPTSLPPRPRGWDQFDARLSALNVRVLNAMVPSGYPFWRLVRAEYQDPEQAGGQHYVSYQVLDEKGSPLPSQRVFQGNSEAQGETRTDASGNAKMLISISYSPERGETGPYSAWVDGLPSDRVAGLGLPVHRQVNFLLTWQRTVR